MQKIHLALKIWSLKRGGLSIEESPRGGLLCMINEEGRMNEGREGRMNEGREG